MPQDTVAKGPGQGWNFDNSYARLPETLFVRMGPVPVRAPRLAVFNRALATQLGLDADALSREAGAAIFAGNQLPEGAEPIAQAYAGHQFGHFTMLGDGRAILLGEHVTPAGQRFDIQLKGSGPTPFSRGGDGRAALGPMLREYIISEAMHGLGIPSTRSLAVVATGETVERETGLQGAVLTRVAASHIRVGTFEYLSARQNHDALRALADHTLRRHYPELMGAEQPHLALLNAVMQRQTALVAAWLHAGFIHGVMNTDNMALSGESIDYGPCAFMDEYDPDTVFSSIDQGGRYSYGNQPQIAQWNLARLAEALLPLLHADQEKALTLGRETLGAFEDLFREAWVSGMRAKLGLSSAEEGDLEFAGELLSLMHGARADYTNTFRDLSAEQLPDAPPVGPLFCDAKFLDWRKRWQARLARQRMSPEAARELMRAHNPTVIARNAFVEEALAAAVEQGDYSVMQRLLDGLARPFDDLPEHAALRTPPPPPEGGYKTFCGT